MDTSTAKAYPTMEEALKDGAKPADLVEVKGPRRAVARVQEGLRARLREQRRRKAARRQQRQSRKRNRR